MYGITVEGVHEAWRDSTVGFQMAKRVNVFLNGEGWENVLISPHIFAYALDDTWLSWSLFLSTWVSFTFP
jgi:hypothetical protein